MKPRIQCVLALELADGTVFDQYVDSAHELYLARGADRVGAPLADEAEEVRWIPLADLPGLITTGRSWAPPPSSAPSTPC
jgi:hypothetical protein